MENKGKKPRKPKAKPYFIKPNEMPTISQLLRNCLIIISCKCFEGMVLITVYATNGVFVLDYDIQMKELYPQMNKRYFFRSHCSFIVNMLEVKSFKLNEAEGYDVEMNHGEMVKVSKGNKYIFASMTDVKITNTPCSEKPE
jgi:hypothetical protein